MGDEGLAARDGVDDATVAELARRYRIVLPRYFLRRGVGPQDAQDLAQEVFVRLSARNALDRVSNIDGYLFAIAANIAKDFFRKRKVRGDHPAESFFEAVQLTDDDSPERTVSGRQELSCIVAALNEMPERMRNIFILARLENIPRAEIAQRLGISKSLIEQQITLATACLSERRRRLV